jgi:hypothetical protein
MMMAVRQMKRNTKRKFLLLLGGCNLAAGQNENLRAELSHDDDDDDGARSLKFISIPQNNPI